MKKFTLFTTLFLAICCLGTKINAQKVAIIGANVESPDGIAIVALENVSSGTKIFFTDKPYNGGGSFGTGEGVWSYTVPSSGLSLGDVVVFNETATSSNVMAMICNIGGTSLTGASCGTFGDQNGSISYSSVDETIYACAGNPSSGVSEIYSAINIGGGIANDGTVNPTANYPNAVILTGFPGGSGANFKDALRSTVGTSKSSIVSALEGPTTNFTNDPANVTLTSTPFTAPSNPILTMSGPASAVNEDGAANLIYTFTLTPAPTGNVTVNFSVGGTAAFSSDYSQSGAAGFTASSGTIVVPTSGSATLTIDPTVDGTLEPDETVIITPTAGTGYDLGSGGSTGTIINDDMLINSCPWVAITGINHTDPDGFSFVALDDIAENTVVYFTDKTFNKSTLTFPGSGQSVISWTAPAGVNRGDVFVLKETSTSSNTFAVSCSDGTGSTCGTVSTVSGSFSMPTAGVGLFAYGDTDANPSNGVTEVYSVLFTGDAFTSGGNIPAIQDPSAVYDNAVVVDGFPASAPNRTEYKASLRNVTVTEGDFENLTKWDHGQANADLSTTPFTNIIIKTGSANSPVTVTVAPGSVNENSGSSLVFTFTLVGPSQPDFDVSFDILGTAIFGTDYTVSTTGIPFTFDGTSGTIRIFNVIPSVQLVITPVGDSDLEPDETVILSIVSGSVYDAGSPGSATGTITNDDVGPATCPLVAVTGLNHLSPDAFSFVALTDIPANTEIYFTDKPYDKANLAFESGESVVKWTAPSGVNQGDVFVVQETATNVLTLTCSDGSGTTCGSLSLTGDFAVGPNGEAFYAYLDADNNPENGVTEILAVLYTGDSETSSPGGNIPANESPAVIYPSSIVVDGFPTTAPNRTEYNPASRNVTVDQAAFENTSNWVHAQANADLSTTAFTQIEILLAISCPADQLSIEGCGPEYLASASNLPYSTTVQTISETDFTGDGGSINSGGTITSITYVDVVSGSYPFTVTRTFTVTDDCPNTVSCTQTFVIDDNTPPSADTPSNIDVTCPANVPDPDISVVTGVTDNCVPESCEIWINELHYDNTGADVGEFVEVAGRAGTDLSNYSIVYYNGASSETYSPSTTLTGIIDNESNGFGAVSFARSDIQNGGTFADGMALVKDGTTVIEFISYEGTITATNGPAAGMTSVDIGVSEPTSQAIGESLGMVGTGNKGADFSFADGAESPGDLNIGQTITPAPPCGGSVTVTFDSDSNNSGAGSAASPLIITRKYKLQDPAGNMAFVNQTINVIDNVAPGITCPADITTNTTTGLCGANVSFSVSGSDNCVGLSIGYSQAPGTFFNKGTTTVTATATDAAGNENSCTFDITVNDNEVPTLSCFTHNLNTNPGDCFNTSAPNLTTINDNCGDSNLTIEIYESGAGTPTETFNYPNAANGTVSESRNWPVGTHTAVITADDNNGNDAVSCTTTIIVTDNEAPNAVCKDFTVQLDVNGEASVSLAEFDGGSTDNCSVSYVTAGQTTFDCGDVALSPFSISFTITDGTNTSICESEVTVEDNEPATAKCKPTTLNLTSDGTTILDPYAVNDGSFTACGGFELSVLPNQFDCDDVGDEVTVTLQATDTSNGNSTTCTTTVTIADPASYCCAQPVANCNENVTVYINDFGNISLPVDQVNNGSTAECGLADIYVIPNNFSCGVIEEGLNPIVATLTIIDINGDQDQCTSLVTVVDNIAPQITCPDDFGAFTDSGQCGATVDIPIPGATDNCGIALIEFRYIEVDPDNGNAEIGVFTDWATNTNVFLPVGKWKVQWRIEDTSGNPDDCDFFITITDNEFPDITCPATITQGSDPGECGADVSFVVNASDNCDYTVVCTIGGEEPQVNDCYGNDLLLSITFDNFPEETSWMIMDLSDNSVAASGGTYGGQPDGSTLDIPINLADGDYMFAILDNASDGICCDFGLGAYTLSSNGDIIVQGGEFGSKDITNFCVTTPVQGQPLTVVESGDFFPVGTTTVTCTVTDASGNSNVCSFDITVNDTEAPQLDMPCPGNITLCGAQAVSWTPPTATDNCAVVASSSTYNPGDFFEVGNYTVAYTFYDAAGLSVSCSFTITINPVPDVQVTQEDLPTWCQGIKVLNAEVLNLDELTPPLTYEWSDGLGNTSSVIAPANGTYFVTVTDALGCFTVESTTIDVDISTLLSAYTIISGEEFEMYESEVLSGGVGIEDADEAEIAQNSSIFTFLRANADDVDVDGSSFINNFIDADFNIDFPGFENNPFNALNSVVVSTGNTMTLSGSNYGYVVVGNGATLIINSPDINIRALYTYKDATIIFNQPTKVKVRRKLYIGESNNINPDGYTTIFFASDNVAISQGTNFNASIFAPEGLEVNDSGSAQTTYMTGMFISNDRIASGDNVIWNWNLNCSYLPETQEPPVINLSQLIDQGIPESLPLGKQELNVFPNPTAGVLNIDVSDFIDQQIEIQMFNALGSLVWSRKVDRLDTTLISADMSNLSQGVYFLQLTSNGTRVSKEVILSK